MPGGNRLALLVVLAAVMAAGPAIAARCPQPCKAETAACIRSRCAGLAGQTKRTCVETCRGIGGCAPIRTLAWVESRIRSDGTGARQALRVRRGNCAPVTVVEFAASTLPEQVALSGALTDSWAQTRIGHYSVVTAFLQRLSVTPDGSGVVFEVTDDGAAFRTFQLPDIAEGFYYVRADGTGLRRLGPQSGVPMFIPFTAPSLPGGLGFGGLIFQSDISPDGRTFVFTDWGPSPSGERTVQVVTLDIATGKRTVVTRLPLAAPPSFPGSAVTETPRFVDDHAILFSSWTNPDGLNPDHDFMQFTVKTDGTGLRAIFGTTPTASADGRTLPRFVIAGGGTNLANVGPLDSAGERFLFLELFIVSGKRVLQLTNFGTSTVRVFLTRDGRRAFFRSQADPLGTNPSRSCQLFSISSLGTGLRQLTHFQEGEHSMLGCGWGPPPQGCAVLDGAQDPLTSEVVFYSSCDPFGTNPFGGQLFAMRPDGSKLRQLTAARGRRVDAEGVVSVELPGPWAYSGRSR